MPASLKRAIGAHFPSLYRFASRMVRASTIRYLYQRRPDALRSIAGYTAGEDDDDGRIIDRVVASYLKRAEMPSGQWADIYLERHRDIHEALLSGNRPRIEELLRRPISSDLMYGFDSMAKTLRRGGQRIEDRHAAALTLDALASLAEAIGARRLENPERYKWRARAIAVHEIVNQIERSFGFEIPVPNFFPSEYGLISPRGVISYRVPQAIWQAWRITQLVRGIQRPKVLEIGGGLGRTAFYARKFGITDYTIIDIPISSLAQGYFLGRSLGERAVTLHGEIAAGDSSDSIKIMSPKDFLEGSERYDLVVNVDSLTGIDRVDAKRYFLAIQARADKFLSVNHESNEFTVADLIRESGAVVHASRDPCWMRRGYLEEVVEFAQGPHRCRNA
jgi:hypothetical protein